MELRQTDQRQRRQRTSESIPSPPEKTEGKRERPSQQQENASKRMKPEVLGDAIDVVVSKVRHDWRELGRKLGLEQVDIDATYEKHRGDPTECCREVLELWRRSNGAQTTLEKLGEALRKAHHVDVAELIECGGNGSDLRTTGQPDSRAPRDVEVVETTESWIKIKWKPPATCVDAQPIGYKVDLRLAGTDTWLKAHNRDYLTTTEFKVCEGLTKKGQYYFRVRSVYLGNILSEPADSPLGIAKIQGQPDEPRNLRVTDLDPENNTVTLEWLEPEDDGGYPITSYIVEKSSGNEWERCLETSELHCKIEDIEGCRLRVSAKNSEGLQSDPLDMVDPELRVRLDVEEADESIKKAAERAIWKSVYLPQGLSGKTIEEGSIVFVYSCSDLLGLWGFWIMYWQGQVEQYFQKLLITKDVLRACAATNVKVGVTIDPEDFHASCNHLLLTRPIEHGYRVLADPKTTDRLIGSVVLSSGLTDRLSSITGITTMQGIGHELADTYKASTSTRGYVQKHHLFRRTKKNRSPLTTAKLTVEHKHGYLLRRKFIPGTEVTGPTSNSGLPLISGYFEK